MKIEKRQIKLIMMTLANIKKIIFLLFLGSTLNANILINNEVYVYLDLGEFKNYKHNDMVEVKVHFCNFTDKNLKVLSPIDRLKFGAFELEAFSKDKKFNDLTVYFSSDHDNIKVEIPKSSSLVFGIKLPIKYSLKADFVKISYYPTSNDKLKTAPVYIRLAQKPKTIK